MEKQKPVNSNYRKGWDNIFNKELIIKQKTYEDLINYVDQGPNTLHWKNKDERGIPTSNIIDFDALAADFEENI